MIWTGNGEITAADTSIVLSCHAELAIGGGVDSSGEIPVAADIDGNGIIAVDDARYVRVYYAETYTGKSPAWEEFWAADNALREFEMPDLFEGE